MSTYKYKTVAIAVLIGASFAIPAHAASSTIRVSCDDQATGAEVSINDKYKGECPIDIQVTEGKHRLKAVKKIGGKDSVFDEVIRIGDGVTKRIEVSFGSAGATTAPAIQIDQNAIAQQRYKAEMEEYNKSVKSCLPKHSIELRRLKQALRDAFKIGWDYCQDRQLNYFKGDNEQVAISCGSPSYDTNRHPDNYSDSFKEEKRELDNFDKDPNSWCEKQFTKPEAP